MEFNVSCPDSSAIRELGAGVCVFISGGIASYFVYHLLPSQPCEKSNVESPELVKQVISLKDEIKYLKCKLASALNDVGRGMDDIRTSQFRLSQIQIGQVSSPPSFHAHPHPPVPFHTRLTPPSSPLVTQPSIINPHHSSISPLARPTSPHLPIAAPPATESKASSQIVESSQVPTSKSRKNSLDSLDDDDEFMSTKESLLDCGNYAPAALRVILDEVDKLNMGTDEDREKAMKMLHNAEITYPNSAQIKWRLARAHLWRYGDSEQPDIKRMHAVSALRCAEDALRLNINSPDVHKWYAVSLATSLDFKSPSDKMEKNKEIITHLEKAIELDPLEPMPYYIKGKWCWGVYKLRWIEKKLTNTMYGAPPSASFEEVVESFLKAEDLAPGFYKANRLYLAKCYLEKEDFDKSKDWLLAAHTLPIRTKEDKLTQNIIEELLRELRNIVDWF